MPDEPNELINNVDVNETKVLTDYLNNIENNFLKFKTIVEEYDVFRNFKQLSKEQRSEDFCMYYPFYIAGEYKYNIPWPLLWIIHVHETTASRDLYPDGNGYVGAMQRSTKFYDAEYVGDAVNGWEFLKNLPQRYTTDKYFKTNDYEEILFAAKKIRNDADQIKKNNNLDFESSVMSAQYNYCARYYAQQRIEKYKEIKPLFMP